MNAERHEVWWVILSLTIFSLLPQSGHALDSLHVSRGSKGECILPLRFGTNKAPTLGDFDILRSEFRGETKAPLLVTLENGIEENRSLLGKVSLDIKNFQYSLSSSISFQCPRSPTQLLLSICSDRKDTGECSKKPIANMDALSKEIRVLAFSPTSRVIGYPRDLSSKGEKLFYAAYMIFDGNTLSIPQYPKRVDSYDDMLRPLQLAHQQLLQKKGVPLPFPERYLRRYAEQLGSIPPSSLNNALEIVLPEFDWSKKG